MRIDRENDELRRRGPLTHTTRVRNAIRGFAEVAIGFAQLFVIWRGLRRWEKSTDELRKQNEQCRAEISPGLDATSQMLEDVGRRLDASTARLGEQLAKSRA